MRKVVACADRAFVNAHLSTALVPDPVHLGMHSLYGVDHFASATRCFVLAIHQTGACNVFDAFAKPHGIVQVVHPHLTRFVAWFVRWRSMRGPTPDPDPMETLLSFSWYLDSPRSMTDRTTWIRYPGGLSPTPVFCMDHIESWLHLARRSERYKIHVQVHSDP